MHQRALAISWIMCGSAARVAAAAGQGFCEPGDTFSGAACNLCKRNEVYVQATDSCACPNTLKTCGDVTPYNNDVITIACVLSTVAIVVHVVYAIFARSAGFVLPAKEKKDEAATTVPIPCPCDLVKNPAAAVGHGTAAEPGMVNRPLLSMKLRRGPMSAWHRK